MEQNMIDLRRGNLTALVVGLALLGPFTAGLWISIGNGDTGGLFDLPVLAVVLASVLSVVVLAVAWAALAMRRPLRLVIDHEGLRLDNGTPKPRWRVGWTELTGVAVVVGEYRAHGAVRTLRRLRGLPDTVRGSFALEMTPLDAEAVRRHPELRSAWELGRRSTWRALLGRPHRGQPEIGELVQRWRPELWRGERTGSMLLG